LKVTTPDPDVEVMLPFEIDPDADTVQAESVYAVRAIDCTCGGIKLTNSPLELWTSITGWTVRGLPEFPVVDGSVVNAS
jgi:hypothetical protein